jgi:hypothetical protein
MYYTLGFDNCGYWHIRELAIEVNADVGIWRLIGGAWS